MSTGFGVKKNYSIDLVNKISTLIIATNRYFNFVSCKLKTIDNKANLATNIVNSKEKKREF